MTRLTDIFLEHRDYLIDKWEQYLGIYESEFAALIAAGRPISLLEIGVQNGGSLQVWKKFLPKGSTVMGIDINPDCERLRFDEGIELIVTDGADKTSLDDALGDRMFDVIIDDGSHRSDHIIQTFQALFPRVKGGGKFIVEDLHASYWPEYRGGFREPQAAMEFLKGLVDGLNSDHFRDTGSTPTSEVDALSGFGRSVSRMTFYDSVAVIELMGVPREAPYRQVFSGGTTEVMPLETLFTTSSRSLAETRLASRTAARHIDRVLLGRIAELSAMVESSRGHAPLEGGLAAENASMREQLATLKASTSWKATEPLRAFARLLGKA